MSEVITAEVVEESLKAHEELAALVSAKKYQLPGEKSFADVIERVISEYKKHAPKFVTIDPLVSFNAIAEMLRSGKFIPAGSILFGLGNDATRSSMSNCYFTPIEQDSIEGIFEAQKKMARTYALRGGTGTDISILRPCDAPVDNAAVKSSGAVSFLPLFSEMTNTIGQNGRRGALMVSLHISHPDVQRFIWCKSKPEEILGKDHITGRVPDVSGANISLKITDAFMQAVENDADWTFKFPDIEADKAKYNAEWNGEYDEWDGEWKEYHTVKARDLLMEIAESAWTSGDPGVLFLDTTQYNTPGAEIHHSLKPVGVNPCFRGDMQLLTSTGYRTFEELAHEGVVEIINLSGFSAPGRVWKSGTKETVEVKFLAGIEPVVCTPDHTFMLNDGSPCAAKDLLGKSVALIADGDVSAKFSEVISVTSAGVCDVYDFTEPETHWGIVNGVIVHNCGEQPLAAWNNCLLGALCLHKFVVDPFEDAARFDLPAFLSTVKTAVNFMNVMSDINEKRHPLQEQRDADAFGKRIGIEITGVGDTFAMLGMEYGSPESVEFLQSVMKAKACMEIATSAEVAKEYGPCAAFYQEGARERFLQSPYVRSLNLPAGKQDFIRKYGLRNTAFNTIGPCGSISIVSGNCSSGIEPVFKFAYTRTTRIGGGREFSFIHRPALEYLQQHRELVGKVTVDNLKQMLSYVDADELDWEQRLEVQAAAQKYTDASISSTVNLAEGTSAETIRDIYRVAWELGLKGVTVFRDGCKKGVLSAVKKEEPVSIQVEKSSDGPYLMELLDEEKAVRHRVFWKGAKLYVIVSVDSDGRPLEVFAKLPREAGINGGGQYSEQTYQEKYSLWETTTRLISLLLRSDLPLEMVIKQLDKGSYSMVDAAGVLARVLRKYLPVVEASDDEIVSGGLGSRCSECGESSYVFENGCGHCLSCGFSTCG